MEQASKIKHGVLATHKAVHDELKKLYWASIRDEVQNMIEFHNVLKEADFQPHAPSSLECDNFKKMFNIWGKCSNFWFANTASVVRVR